MYGWANGWMGSSQLGTSAWLGAVPFALSPPSSVTSPPSPSEPAAGAPSALHRWSQLGMMILHVPSHRQRSGWRAAVWSPASGSGSSADPCKSCSSDRSSFSQAPGTAVHQIQAVHGVHHDRPPAAAMTLDRFVGPLSADSSPPPLPAIVAARGCRAGGSRTGPPCKSTAKDHPDHVPSQRGLEGTPRLRTSTWGRRLAEDPLRPRSCRNLTAQRG